MKLSMLVVSVFAATAIASPNAVSLKRSFKDVSMPAKDGLSDTLLVPCVECPCDGFGGECPCVPNGCCC